MRCDFHVEGSETQWWSEIRDVVPEIGEHVEHRQKNYIVIDLAGIIGGDLVLVSVRRTVDQPALV